MYVCTHTHTHKYMREILCIWAEIFFMHVSINCLVFLVKSLADKVNTEIVKKCFFQMLSDNLLAIFKENCKKYIRYIVRNIKTSKTCCLWYCNLCWSVKSVLLIIKSFNWQTQPEHYGYGQKIVYSKCFQLIYLPFSRSVGRNIYQIFCKICNTCCLWYCNLYWCERSVLFGHNHKI